MEFDDAYQELFVKFSEMSERYAGRVTNPKWFMALFKRAVANRITDFANQANRQRRQVCFAELQALDDPMPYVDKLIGVGNVSSLEIMLEEVPDGVREVIAFLTSGETERLAIASESWEQLGKRKDGGNQFLCSMLGYDHTNTDLVYATRKFLEEL